jgi:hypothetical protein
MIQYLRLPAPGSREQRQQARCYHALEVRKKLTFLSLKLRFLSLKLTFLSFKLTFLSLKLAFLSSGTQQPPIFITNSPYKTYGDYCTSVDI